uniref:Genome polyprotein n=1 Tax=Cafluga virus TaxID=2800907 RepID=A0A894KGU3_9VIRU|nr:MAG: polyprotein [Cafluga virus]
MVTIFEYNSKILYKIYFPFKNFYYNFKMVYQIKNARINRSRFSSVKYNLGAIQNRVSRRCFSTALHSANGRFWKTRVFNRALFAELVENEVSRLLGTCDVFLLLDRLNDGQCIGPIGLDWIDCVLEKHFLRYLNRIDLNRYKKLVTLDLYPTRTIEYFFLLAKKKLYSDINTAEYYNKCLESIVSRNIYSLLKEEECHCDTQIDVIESCVEHNVVRMQRVRKRIYDDLHNLVDEHIPPPNPPPRSPVLLRKLRALIARLTALRTNNESEFDGIELPEIHRPVDTVRVMDDIVPQMMEPMSEQCEEKGPVVLTNSETCKEVPTIVEPPETFWAKASTSDAMVDQEHASNFDILVTKFKWNQNQSNGSSLFEIDLPIEALSKNNDHPAAMMFQQYAYAIFTMRARLHINTTPMHIGKVVMFFYYSAKQDIHYRNRFNIANAVQLPHVFFNASSGEDACLDIPFRNHRSFLCTRKRLNDSKALYLGTLKIMVFNRLHSANDESDVDGYLHLSFQDCHFSGILKRSAIKAQMFSIPRTMQMAESALHLINKASNMDKPPVPAVPSFIQPTFTSSMASGTGDISTVNHLRLDPRGQTQHPSGSTTRFSETLVSSIKLIPGLLTQVAWNTSTSSGFKLWEIEATLAQPRSSYPEVRIKVDGQAFAAYVLPPVCMLADMHAFSRGAFEIIVEIVCSRFHTGALLIGYTPAVTTQTFDEAIQSYNMTLDVGANSRYTFKVPYIAERPLAARFNRSNASGQIDVQSNGVIGLYVLNALRATSSSSVIPINIYIKGTEENEFMCLTAPTFTILYDKVEGEFPEKTVFPEAQGAIGCGVWRYSSNIVNNMAVMRYGAGSDHVLQFIGLEPFVVYRSNFQGAAADLQPITAQTIARNLAFSASAIDIGGPEFIAMLIVNGDGNKYRYAVPFPSLAVATQYVDTHIGLVTTTNPYPDSPRDSDFFVEAPAIIYCGYSTAPESYRTWSNNRELQYVVEYRARKKFSDIVPQMNNAVRANEPAPSCRGTLGIKKLLPLENGMRLFGESFDDLKTYTKRYQIYTQFEQTIPTSNSYIARIPLVPCGLKPEGATSVTREGIIPYINANYMFGRGGMQLKVMIDPSYSNDDSTYYLQHKYDIHSNSRVVEKWAKNLDKIPSNCLQSGYAFVAFNPKVNPTVTIEIPCYIATNLFIVQRTDPRNEVEVVNGSLGVLDIFNFSKAATNKVQFTVWYALADDFDYSVYLGMPPVVPIDNIQTSNETNDWTLIPQAGEPKKKETPVVKEVQAEGLLDAIKRKLTGYKERLIEGSVTEHLREKFNLPPSESQAYGDLFADLFNKVGEEYKHLVISILSQIIHFIKTPTLGTGMLCIGTLFVHLGFEFGVFDTILTKVGSLFRSDKTVEPQGGENESEESPKAIKFAFVRSIVAACARKFGCCITKIKDIPYTDFSKGIWSNIRFGSITFNALITLIKNLIEYVPIIFEWLAKTINPARWWRMLWHKDQDFIDEWILQCNEMLDPKNAEKVHFDPRSAVLLQMLVLIGKELAVKMTKLANANTRQFSYIRALNTELNKLYTELIMSNSASGVVRAEPYCFCVHGLSQVGKTHNAQAVAEYALAETGYKSYSDPTYTRQPGQHFWTSLMGQLICVVEDFLQFEESEKAWCDLYDVIHLVSCQVFQPPQAEIEKKYIRFAPLIVVLTMNKGFKRIKGVADNNAWMNRRHDLFEFVNAGEVKEYNADGTVKTRGDVISPKYMGDEAKRTNNYLMVRKNKYRSYCPPGFKDEIQNVENIYESVYVPTFDKDGNITSAVGDNIATTAVEQMNFYQFRWYVKERFATEYARIIKQYKEALVRLTSFWPKEDSSLSAKIEKFAECINIQNITMTPSEQELIKLACEKTNFTMCNICMHRKSECACREVAFMNTERAKEIIGQAPEAVNADYTQFVGAMSVGTSVPGKTLKDVNFMQRFEQFEKTSFPMKNDFPCTMEAAACLLLSKPKWIAESKKLFSPSCPHELLLLAECLTKVPYFEFNEENFCFLTDTFQYPSKECCKVECATYWQILRQIESIQISEGMIESRIPVIKENTNTAYKKAFRFIKNTYDQYAQDYKKFRDEVSVPDEWYVRWGKKLFSMCKVMFKIVGVAAAVFGIKHLFDVTRDHGYSTATRHVVDTLTLQNSLTAKCLLSHVPDGECVKGNCRQNICGNMAYNPSGKKIPKVVIAPQMATDLKHNIERLLQRNTFFIRASFNKEGEKHYIDVRCIGLRGNYFIAIDHYFDKFQSLGPDTIFEFIQPSLTKEIGYARLSLRRLEDSCLVLGVLPKTIPAFANIVPKICSIKQSANLTRDGLLYELHCDGKYYRNNVYSQTFELKQQYQYVPPVANAIAPTRVNTYYEYGVGGVGMCGSILVSDSNIGSPIIGIHYAGTRDNKTGFAELLSRETFENIFEELDKDSFSAAIEHVDIAGEKVIIDPQISATSVLHGNYKPIGCVKPAYAHRPPPHSKQMHSECYNEIFESTYDYPLLSPRDPRAIGSPMVIGCTHHTNPPKDFDESLLKEAVDVVRGSILSQVKPQRLTVGVLTRDEVIVGIADNQLYNALEFDTSEGFPFVKYRPEGAKDKRWLFDLENSEQGYVLNGVNPILTSVMDEKQRQREAGLIPITVFTDCLKDIKVPAEKIQPRIFSISPADFTIQFKQYYSDFMIAYQEARFNVNSAIGINVDSLEWTKMVNRLLENSPHFGCGDYSKFGPRLMSIVVKYAFELMNEWYELHGDVENNQIRKIMAHEVMFSYHMMFNFVYMVVCGAPSGSPITTILNNIVNVIYLAYVWCFVWKRRFGTLEYTMDTTGYSYSSFFYFVMLICYGDDLIMTIREEVLAIFNPMIIQEVLALYDIKFTDACKTGTQYASLTVFDSAVSFLKRNIAIHPRRTKIYLAKMDKRAIQETCNWIHKCANVREMSIISCQSMLLNAHGHGPIYYDNMRKQVRNFWFAKGVDCMIPSWDEVDFRIFGENDIRVLKY